MTMRYVTVDRLEPGMVLVNEIWAELVVEVRHEADYTHVTFISTASWDRSEITREKYRNDHTSFRVLGSEP